MSQRENLESRIREQRLAEATKKGLMGQSGKIGTVLKFLGSPVVAQTEAASFLDVEGTGVEEEGIPVMDVEGAARPEGPEWGPEGGDAVPFSTRSVGMHFDGLGRGMHLEVLYKEDSSEMSVYHRGSLVYRESQGDLLCYVPSDEWEGWISSLFVLAKKVQREQKELEFQSRVKDAERAKASWLRDLASRWGLT